MRGNRRNFILTILVLAVGVGGLRAQINHVPSRERVDPSLRRKTEIDGNNVRTSVFNFVFSGRTGAGQGVPYEWPKNTGRHYVALVALFVGAEVKDDTGRTIRIVDLPAFRQKPGGADWNMNPVPGYFNVTTGKIAKSDEPATWPPTWPDKMSDPGDPGWAGKWNGFFGKNQFNADQEMYYRVGDNNYDRYLYTPDTTDPTRRGLGMIIDVRVLEWSQISVADAVFFIQEIKNDGTKDLSKTAITLWLADFVGGDGDSQDDSPDFDLILDIAYSLDADGVSSNKAFQGVFVGAAATLYLETPGNAEDRIDNDGDGETGSPAITSAFLAGAGSYPAEVTGNQVDENHNGLIDEDSTYIPFGQQRGVGYADGVDNNGNGEAGSPVVTQAMIDAAALDPWKRWPPFPENDSLQQGIIHLIGLDQTDLGARYTDHIDNDGNSAGNFPAVTQAMIDLAAGDPFRRYRVPGTNVILYNLVQSELGRKYLDGIGKHDVAVDEGIDEMVDESRNDAIDNDGDWSALADDVGLDGASNTNDFGEGDGRPTSGVGTSFPGEPNIDKTDISEADQIGLTNVQYLAAGAVNFSTTPDVYYWIEFMLPGSFVDPSLIGTGEKDLFVSSGVFPLKAGQIERISYAVVFGNASRAGNANVSGAKADAIRKRDFAQLAYTEDYKFAQAPIEPVLTAVPGNNRVTLYWDDAAEKSHDRFLAGISGANPNDFEGYRIFRSTDPAFEDSRVITDAFGSPAPFLKPIVQYDLNDGIKGFHPIAFNGVQFYQGDDTGIRHSWVDSSVKNGFTYYYAIRAYDQGYTPLNISPAESNLKINVDDITGRVKDHGTSVAIVTPQAPAGGYVKTSDSPVKLVRGSTTGTVDYTVEDPTLIKDNHRYRVTFEDTLIFGRPLPTGEATPDTYRTRSYTLADITDTTSLDTLTNQSRNLADSAEQRLTDGFRLALHNESFFGLNADLSDWSNDSIYPFVFQQWIEGGFVVGQQRPSDYRIEFGPLGIDTSIQFLVSDDNIDPPVIVPAIPINFRVLNVTENRQIEVAFAERNLAGGAGVFSAAKVGSVTRSDIIVFVEPDSHDSLITTYSFKVRIDTNIHRSPVAGDVATIILSKLFRTEDVFEFSMKSHHIDVSQAKSELDRIRVVPNPYVAVSSWEPKNPATSGRGPRSIHFTHLPQQCTIRIYTVSGEHVMTIEHDKPILDGEEEWNLLTKDNLSASYGVYVYHIDAPGIGEKIGKFAIIK